MANNNYAAKATAQITIVDTTDASYLSGGLSIVSGSRNQIYVPTATGDSAYSPNWKFNNLVIRPFLTASNIKKAEGTTYLILIYFRLKNILHLLLVLLRIL